MERKPEPLWAAAPLVITAPAPDKFHSPPLGTSNPPLLTICVCPMPTQIHDRRTTTNKTPLLMLAFFRNQKKGQAICAVRELSGCISLLWVIPLNPNPHLNPNLLRASD